ncbi:MAG: cupin-like domain-containing protein, partial [Bacteroidales bacterium]|nr:cupin-like domain-containing protein [Bacteroidales bacterium]
YETLGHAEVGVFDGALQKHDRSFKKPHRKMKFGHYIKQITSNEDSDVRLFLFNIFKHAPDLRNDFDFPPLTRLYLKSVPFMFFGGKNAVVRMHQDMDWSNVFLTQLHGKKEVILFHPKYSKLLYRYPFNVHSAVDIERPDYSKFPGLVHVEGMRCVLEPGDTLFIPSGHWHYIKYLEGGYAINQRALSPYPSRWLRGLWHVAVLSNADEIMRWTFGDTWYKYKYEKALTVPAKNCKN